MLLIERNGLSQESLAKELGVSQGAVSNWKRGARPRNAMLIRLATYFGVDPVVLRNDNLDIPAQIDNREARLEEFLTKESPLKDAKFKDEQDVIHAIQFLGQWLCEPDYRKELISVTRKILDRYFVKEADQGFDRLKTLLRSLIKNAADDAAMVDNSKILEELVSENPTVDGLLFRLWKIPPRK